MFSNKKLIQNLAEKHPDFYYANCNTKNNMNQSSYIQFYTEVNRLKELAQRYQSYYLLKSKSQAIKTSHAPEHVTERKTHTPYDYPNMAKPYL